MCIFHYMQYIIHKGLRGLVDKDWVYSTIGGLYRDRASHRHRDFARAVNAVGTIAPGSHEGYRCATVRWDSSAARQITGAGNHRHGDFGKELNMNKDPSTHRSET